MVSDRIGGKSACILAAGCLVLCLLAGATVANQPDPDPKPPTPAEIQDYRAALEDPLDSVVIAARDMERAGLILVQLLELPKDLAQWVVELWLSEPTPAGTLALAANDILAARAAQVAELWWKLRASISIQNWRAPMIAS